MTSQPVQTNNEAYTEVGWYILDANQQQIGPYRISELREHYLNGYLPESTFVWSEGRSEWQQLSSVPELMAEVYGDKTQSLSSGHEEQSKVSPQETVSTYSESGTAPVSNDDEFEKWQNEVKKAEAEAELLKNGTASSQLEGFEHDRPSTPPEGEQEFIDDDGTLYKWDRSIRAWVPQVGAGILAIPAVIQVSGFLASTIACIGCWAYMVVTGLYIVEVNLNTMCELGSGGVSLVILLPSTS